MFVYGDVNTKNLKLIARRGAFSVVREAIHNETGQKYAIKSIDKKHISKNGWVNLTREIEIMMNVNHPNILRMKEYVDTESCLHMVLE